MTAKEYLEQAIRLDQRINTKIEQVASLNALATKCTFTINGMPHSPDKSRSTMADAIEKIIDLQEEINRDIDRLIDLKCEIVSVIKAVDNPEYQTILEKRYLCFMQWKQIAADMEYDLRYLFKIHSRALAQVKIPHAA